jgi:hypothetical protein
VLPVIRTGNNGFSRFDDTGSHRWSPIKVIYYPEKGGELCR